MFYDKDLIARKLRRWEQFLHEYRLPAWEEIPNLELYMDQVITLLNHYLDFLPREEKADKVITATAINNYVRLKIMPAPKKKRYSRIHIAYLIMICTLKQTLTISDVQKIIPMGLSESAVRELYDNYAGQHREMAEYFISQVRANGRTVLDADNQEEEHPVENLVSALAVLSGFCRLLTEKIVQLQNLRDGDMTDEPETSTPGEAAGE